MKYRKKPVEIEAVRFYPCKPDIFEATYEPVDTVRYGHPGDGETK